MPLAVRLRNKLDVRGPDECWPWTGHIGKFGYATISLGGAKSPNARAHRVAYELAIGPIPEGLMVLHRCDNRRCCNPAHLFLGTHQDNMADMVAKSRQSRVGTRQRGAVNGNAKLTDEQVLEIRAAAGTYGEIGKKFGIGKQHVCDIKRRAKWAHL